MENKENEEEEKQTSRFTSSTKTSPRNETSQELKVLDPDNPLLEKFQKALKEHYLRQIEHLKQDIFEYEGGAKKNNAKREELGILVYEEQQIVSKQQTILDNYISRLETVTSAREEIDNVLKEKKEIHKQERNKLMDAEASELELRNEVEGLNLLINQMTTWEDNLESDITIKKRVYEKSRKDKMKLMEEKRIQDALIYKLMMRIWELERELERMDVQVKVKEEEREEMAQTVALGNTNIEAIESEYRYLMHSWNSVVIAIGNRDKVLSCLGKEYTKAEEEFKSILAEIEQAKKLCNKELKKNEELSMIRDRFAADIQNCKMNLDAELGKKRTIERRMNEMHRIIEQAEIDMQKNAEEVHEATTLLNALGREFTILDSQKADIEDKILRLLEDQVTSEKIVANLKRVYRQLRNKNRELEINLATTENRIAAVQSEIETQKFMITAAQKYLTELELQVRELEKEADQHQEEIKKLDLIIGKRQREVDLLNNKYQRITEKSGASTRVPPLEAKIINLEKSIEEIFEENKKLQQFWLREQTNLIKLSEERQEQIHTQNLLRKQILILEQKNLKITDILELQKREEEKVTRNIVNLQNRLSIMCDNFCKKKGLADTMGKDNDVMRQDYIYKLKDAELECLQLGDEIAQIEDEKLNLSKELIDLNREVLEWEKKFLHAKELKSTMIEERSKEGEVGNMKVEIHRMQVRYSQLKKVQDVLIHDLENCVARRDAIMTVAEAREKRSKDGMEKTRFNFARKLDDMKNKIKQMENEVETMKEKLNKLDREKMKVQMDMDLIEKEIFISQTTRAELNKEIEESKTQRQMNFELLVQLQKKLNLYTDFAKGRKPHITHKTECFLSTEYNKQKEINDKLTKIVENLQNDFPNHFDELNRIMNTLKLPILVSLP